MNKINLKSTDKSSRLDSMVFNLGLSESRAKASDLIKEGKVLVNSKTISKPSYLVKVDDEILIEDNSKQWVSRGAIKLLFAINSFELDLVEKVVYDIGASTGGFTQVCLEKGAKLVYSIDVGTDQLHEKLKNDKRVFDISSTDIRAIRNLNIPTPDLLVVDLSFISLTVALPIIMLTVPSKTKMISA